MNLCANWREGNWRGRVQLTTSEVLICVLGDVTTSWTPRNRRWMMLKFFRVLESRVDWPVDTNVSEKRNVSIFRAVFLSHSGTVLSSLEMNNAQCTSVLPWFFWTGHNTNIVIRIVQELITHVFSILWELFCDIFNEHISFRRVRHWTICICGLREEIWM